MRPGYLKIVFNKESTPYWFHRSKVLLQLPPHAEVPDGVVNLSEACSEAEEEDADGEDNDSADDPGSDDSKYTGKGTAKRKESTKKATVEPEGADSGEGAPQGGCNSKTKSKKRGNPSILAAEFARHLADAPVERRQPLLEEIETATKPYVLEVLHSLGIGASAGKNLTELNLLLADQSKGSISVESLFDPTPAVMEFKPVDWSDFGNSKQPTDNKKKGSFAWIDSLIVV